MRRALFILHSVWVVRDLSISPYKVNILNMCYSNGRVECHVAIVSSVDIINLIPPLTEWCTT
jgi:hypothetical protein